MTTSFFSDRVQETSDFNEETTHNNTHLLGQREKGITYSDKHQLIYHFCTMLPGKEKPQSPISRVQYMISLKLHYG